jgi:methylsterol monooxygenase
LHQGQLYKKIHKLHHEFSAPFGLAAEYAHPLEILILGTGTIGGPLLWCVLSNGNLHILTMYIWIMLRLFREFPCLLHHCVLTFFFFFALYLSVR